MAAAADTAEVEDSEEIAAVEEDGSAEVEDTEEVDDMDDGVLDAAFEDASLDEQTYEEDEDDFIPSEEIPADEPIPFPSNICNFFTVLHLGRVGSRCSGCRFLLRRGWACRRPATQAGIPIVWQ